MMTRSSIAALTALAASAVLLLSACGGGGGGPPTVSVLPDEHSPIPPIETPPRDAASERQITTSFRNTRLGHYPLHVRRVRPEAPQRSDFEGVEYYDSAGNLLPPETRAWTH